jgi:hypothetical protein
MAEAKKHPAPAKRAAGDAKRPQAHAGTENLDAWLDHVVAAGGAEPLQDLEAWLRGLTSYMQIRYLPLGGEERRALVARSFAGEIRVVREALHRAERAANEVVALGLPKLGQFEAFLENEIRRRTTLDYHVGKILEQPTPLDSLHRLAELLNDFEVVVGGLEARAQNCQAFLSLGRSFRRGLSDCRYVDMLLHQRFKVQIDRIDNAALSAMVRGIPVERVRERVASALLHLYRLLRNLRLVSRDLDGDRPVRQHLVVFALLRQEVDELAQWLRVKFLKGRVVEEHAASAVELLVLRLRAESKRALERELVGVAAEPDAQAVETRVRKSRELLRNCFENCIVTLSETFDRAAPARLSFEGRSPRADESRRLEQDLWGLRDYLRTAVEHKEDFDLARFVLKIEEFRQHPQRYLMYRQWGEFDGHARAVLSAPAASALPGLIRKLVRFLEDLTEEVSDLPEPSFRVR